MVPRIASIAAVVLLFVLALIFTALNPQEFDVDVGVGRFDVSAGLAP
jgi:hypothetical protein